MLLYVFTYTFLTLFFFFFIKKSVFIIFISFFDEVSNFRKQNINQLETRIGDKKLLVELYV